MFLIAAGVSIHHGHDAFPAFGIGYAKNDAAMDEWVTFDGQFDRVGVQLAPGDIDEITGASPQEHATLPEFSQIRGGEHTLGQRLRGRGPIALTDCRSVHAQATLGSDRELDGGPASIKRTEKKEDLVSCF